MHGVKFPLKVPVHAVDFSLKVSAHGVDFPVKAPVHGVNFPLKVSAHSVDFPVEAPVHGVNFPLKVPAHGVNFPVKAPVHGVNFPVKAPVHGVNFPLKVPAHGVNFPVKAPVHGVDFPVKTPVHGVNFSDKVSTQAFHHAPDQPDNANADGNGCQNFSHDVLPSPIRFSTNPTYMTLARTGYQSAVKHSVRTRSSNVSRREMRYGAPSSSHTWGARPIEL